MLNRGDRSVIAVAPGKELNNPLSGSVVDLCPVGALTHRNWRFNTRIWFTKQTDGICSGCSTGCNVKVAERDGLVVQVKARSNGAVNKSWLCDEGRYGFSRFLPENRQVEHEVGGVPSSFEQAISAASAGLKGGDLLVLVEPSATLEDLAVIKALTEKEKGKLVIAHRERSLSDVEKILISPNYSANIGGAEWLDLASASAAAEYSEALAAAAAGKFKRIIFFGNSLIGELPTEFKGEPFIVSVITDSSSPLRKISKVVIAGRSIVERSGLLINSAQRLQYTDRFVEFPAGTIQHWKVAAKLMSGGAAATNNANADRDITMWLIGSEPRLKGLSINQIKNSGVCMKSYTPTTGGVVIQGAA
jgi:NADH-quinone oxidoreductase subunit G